MNKAKQILFIISALFSFSFFLNFFWESAHGFLLYQDHQIDSGAYVRMMIKMSFFDSLTIVGIYLFLALFQKNMQWLRQIRKQDAFSFFLFGLIVAIFAEYWAVYVVHNWAYNDFMPVVFGIGVSPLLQLSLTGLSSVWLTNKLIN